MCEVPRDGHRCCIVQHSFRYIVCVGCELDVCVKFDVCVKSTIPKVDETVIP